MPGEDPNEDAGAFPPVTSGPIGGNGGVEVEAHAVGKVVQDVQTFHQFRPVPPLGCAVVGRKKEGGRVVLLGIKLLNDAALPVSTVGISEVEEHVVDQPGLEELPQYLTAPVIVS